MSDYIPNVLRFLDLKKKRGPTHVITPLSEHKFLSHSSQFVQQFMAPQAVDKPSALSARFRPVQPACF